MNLLPKWVIQKNLGSGDGFDQLVDALEANSILYEAVDIVPFSDDYPAVLWNGPIIAYGSTRFVTNIHDKNEWQPGVFFNHDKFSMAEYIKYFGEHMLNANSELMTIKEYVGKAYSGDREIFVRPQRDLKEFEARVTTTKELRKWLEIVCQGDFELKPDTPILIAKPIQILMEWRCFIIDRTYCSGSQYMKNGGVDIDEYVPKNVIDFANKAAKIWSPDVAFALDIGLTDAGLKIIEVNCFNSSGFYASDVNKIVNSVTQLYISPTGIYKPNWF